MRPTDAFGRARPSESDATTFQSPAGPQMTYFLADETSLEASHDQSLPPLHCSRDPRKLQTTGKAEAGPSSLSSPVDPAESLESTSEADKHSVGDGSRPTTPSYKSSGTPASHALPSLSQPMTPIMLGTSGPASALSSSSSRRNSLEGSLLEGLGSGAMSMAEDAQLGQSSNMMDSGSAPQLIMPSIKMPSRRPFTEEGKRIGRLKVLVAGESGMTSFFAPVFPSTPSANQLEHRHGEDLSHKGHRPVMRAHRACGSYFASSSDIPHDKNQP